MVTLPSEISSYWGVDSSSALLSDIKSAIRFHIDSFGKEVLEVEPRIIEAFVAETGVEV